MRGPPAFRERAGARPPPSNEADGKTTTIPAPVGGWNARGNLSNMPATDAVLMDNVFPGLTTVSLRRGSTTWATGFGSAIKRLMPYESVSGGKIFASTTTGVYDATTQGAIGAAAFACTSGEWSSINFSNSGGSFLVAVNGTDFMRVYDGATWTAINAVSTPALTGVVTSTLNYVSLFKHRLWFVQNNSMDLWYLPTDAFAGAAVKFPVGGLFSKGGKIVAIGDWTLDNGSGLDDYFVIVTSKGQLAIYKGTDPASSTTFVLVGVFFIGAPVGDRPLCDLGGDLVLLTKNGIFPLSAFLQSTTVDLTKAINNKIQEAFLDYIEAYGANIGWDMQAFYPGNFFTVNVPAAVGSTSYQLVMNLSTKSWCRFTGWNAADFVVYNSELYFAGGTHTTKAWIGTADDATPIQGDVIQAYNALGMQSQKQVAMIRPQLSFDGSATIRYSIDTDFRAYEGNSLVSYLYPAGTGIWDLSLWDAALWSIGSLPIKPTWLTVPCEIGYLQALRLQITSSVANVTWTATNYLFKPAGVL